MAGAKIRGITIEIGADTSGLSKALKGIDSQLKSTQNALRDVNKLLKLDPTNTDLLKQKQALLRDVVSQTSEKLQKLKELQKDMEAKGIDKNSDQYRALQREIAATEQELRSATKEANNFVPALAKIQAVAKKAASGLKAAAEKTRALSTAAAGALTAIGALGVKALNSADDLQTLSKQTGISTDELQQIQYASELVDVSLESITGALRKMKSKMDPANEAFSSLGVSVTNADGSLRDATDVFYDSLTALSKIENETERDQKAMELFGKSADELAGIIDDGGAALKAYGKEAQRAGAIMDKETIEALNDMKDEFDRIKARGMATLIKTGANALKALTPVIEKATKAIGKVFEWISKLSPQALKTIGIILAAVAAISPLLSLLSGLSTAIAFLASPIGIAIAAITALIAAGVLLWKNWDKIKAFAKSLADSVVAAFNNLKQSVVNAMNNLKDAVTNAWSNIKSFVTNTASNIKNSVVNAWTSLKTSVSNTVSGLVSKIKGLFSFRFSLPTLQLPSWSEIKTKLQAIINNIKDIFKFDFHLPKLKLPHIRLYGGVWPWGLFGQGKLPKFSVDWYKKAYANPVMFTSPTVLPTAGGFKGFGDGHGAEIVMGLNKLQELVGASGDVVINVYPSAGMDVNQLADAVQARFVSLNKQRRLAHA